MAKTMHHWRAAVGMALSTAACGGTAVIDGQGGFGGGTTTSSTTGSTTSSVTTSSTTTSTTPTLCGRTDDRFWFKLWASSGEAWGCDFDMDTQLGELTFEAEVTRADQEGLVLNLCPPNANCPPTEEVLHFDAPGLDNPVPEGAYVEVRLAVERPWACTARLRIKNLIAWGGELNPVMGVSVLWLEAADGVAASFSGGGYGVSTAALGCYPNGPSCGPPEDDYLMTFLPDVEPSNAIELQMGSEQSWIFEGPLFQERLNVRNLRSYESGACDDHWNWAFWLARQAPEG